MIRRVASRVRSGILLVLAGLVGCASAPRIVGPVRPAIRASQVMIFTPPLVPKHYVVVAQLDGEGFGGYSFPSYDRRILRKLRREAARLGANGLLLVPYGNSPFPSKLLRENTRTHDRLSPLKRARRRARHCPAGRLDATYQPCYPELKAVDAIEVPHWKRRDLKRMLKLLKDRP